MKIDKKLQKMREDVERAVKVYHTRASMCRDVDERLEETDMCVNNIMSDIRRLLEEQRRDIFDTVMDGFYHIDMELIDKAYIAYDKNSYAKWSEMREDIFRSIMPPVDKINPHLKHRGWDYNIVAHEGKILCSCGEYVNDWKP